MKKVLSKKEEFLNCDLGLYKIYWKEKEGGGFSYASVGNNYMGIRWVAPTNWTAPGKQNPTQLMSTLHKSIAKMEWIAGWADQS